LSIEDNQDHSDHRGQRGSCLDRFLAELPRDRQQLSTRRAEPGEDVAQSRHLKKRVVVVVFLLTMALSSFGMGIWPSQSIHSLTQTGQNFRRAALLDSLSLTDHDPSFIWNVTRTLNLAGYTVDYYPPSQVTVALFRDLPSKSYGLVIIRSHTAIYYGVPTSVSIVTSEIYDKSRYVYEQLGGQVAPAVVRPGNTFFAITPSFFKESMQGNFRGAIVVQMGCSSLQGNHYIATAFINKGASNFVGWDDSVGSGYTDRVTQNFVSSLARGDSVGEAVGIAGGPDPTFGGKLSFLDTALPSSEHFDDQLIAFGEFGILLSVTLLITARLVRGATNNRHCTFRTPLVPDNVINVLFE